MMSTMVYTVMTVLMLLGLLVGVVMMSYALWTILPEQRQERLAVALRRLTGRRVSVRSGPPVYAVHVAGQLRYASGQEDVEDVLCTACMTASRQVMRLVDAEGPATLVLTCGEESLEIEVNLA